MRTASPNCARRSTASPAANCSTRSNSKQARPAGAQTGGAGIARHDAQHHRRRPDHHRLGQAEPAPEHLRFPARRIRQALADQRHGDLYAAARSRGAARIARLHRARLDRRRQAHARRRRRRDACACRTRSTAWRRSRPRRSRPSRKATIHACGACAACSPISASMPASRRRPAPGRKIAAPATGGPYVAAAMRADTASFERQLYRINLARAHVDKLNRTLAALPVRKPVFGDIDMSSPLRHAHGSVRQGPRHPYRHRHARRHRRSGARHRERHRGHRRRQWRLRQDGRDRSRQWIDDALRRISRRSTSRSARASASGTSLARSVPPAARPARICITKRASTATRSIRRNICGRGSGSARTELSRVPVFSAMIYSETAHSRAGSQI